MKNEIKKIILLLATPILFFCFTLKADAAIVKSPPTWGLVGYWSFNEGTSTTALDYSGNKNNGTLVNSPVWVNGKMGKALSFISGSNTLVSIPAITLPGQFTISFWWNSTDSSNTNMAIGINAIGSSATPKIGIVSSKFFVRIVSSSDNTVPLPSLNNWHFIVITRNSSDMVDLQVDGGVVNRLFSNTAQSGTFSPAIIGSSGTSGGQGFGGKLDEVRIYNRALSPQEILQIFNSSSQKFVESPNTGLVGYWSFNEGTSTTALDYSGNKNNGTLVNSPVWVNGKMGKALSFSGTNYVSVPLSNRFLQNGMTISLWIFLKGVNSLNRIVDKSDGSLAQNGFTYFVNSTGDAMRFLINGSTQVSSNVGQISQNKWIHVAVTLTSNSIVQHYINGAASGASVATGALSGITTQSTLCIGLSRTNCSTNGFIGLIDEVRIYNRALSPQEILQIFNSSSQKFVESPNTGLVGYWSFNEGTSTTALDYSGNKNNGTLVNGPVWVNGKMGKALSFDGSTNYVVITSIPSISTSYTVSAWIKTKTTSSNSVFIGYRSTSQGNPVIFQLDQNNADSRFIVKDDAGNIATAQKTNSLKINTWYHLVGVRSGNNVSIYVNGIAGTGASSTFGTITANSLNIGATVNGGAGRTFFTNGLIDEVLIYNRALSPQEILQLFNAGR